MERSTKGASERRGGADFLAASAAPKAVNVDGVLIDAGTKRKKRLDLKLMGRLTQGGLNNPNPQ